MDKFTAYEHETLTNFIAYLDSRIINDYRREISENPDAPAELVRAVEQYPSNIIPIRQNRPDALNSDQWDDLLYLLSKIANETAQNNMTRQIRSKNAGKCYQILLAKALSRQADTEVISQPDQTINTDPVTKSSGSGRPFALRLSQLASLLLLLALLVILVLFPKSSLLIVLIAAFAVSLVISFMLMFLDRHRSRKNN